MSKTLKDLIGRLIACERSPFDEDDRTALEGFPEDRLTELVESYAKPPEEPKAETRAAAKVEPDPHKPMSEAEWLAAAPADVRSLVERSKAEEEERRSNLIAAIRAADEALTADELQAESTASLHRLARLAEKTSGETRQVDYRGLSVPGASGEDRSFLRPPDPYKLNTGKGAN